MLSLPQDDYFNSLHALALKYADEGSCFMHLNAADLKRLPDSFAGTLKADLKKKNCLLDMSNTAVDIKGGFILVYGDIEINCSFEALLAGREAELKDLIYKHIF
jgi:V/A-type H+-transporting ATPase subunit E